MLATVIKQMIQNPVHTIKRSIECSFLCYKNNNIRLIKKDSKLFRVFNKARPEIAHSRYPYFGFSFSSEVSGNIAKSQITSSP